MHPSLTPERLTFLSYRHSQGTYNLQNLIFDYARLVAGVRPEFELDDETIQRYARFLSCGPVVHVDPNIFNSPHKTSNVYDVIRNDLRGLETQNGQLDDSDTSETVVEIEVSFGKELLAVESDVAKRLLNPESASRAQFLARHAERLRQGKLSFIHYYGREGNPAEHELFSQLYRNAWKHIESRNVMNPELSPQHSELIGQLAVILEEEQ